MKIPVLDTMLEDMTERGDTMQETLYEIRDLLVKIEQNTRPDPAGSRIVFDGTNWTLNHSDGIVQQIRFKG